jgi:chromosomal replication initiation ATPase DnaA
MSGADTPQLPLELPHTASFNAADYIISDCNRDAAAFVFGWPAWPAHVCILAGPPGSGKSHLGSIWREKAGGNAIAAAELGQGDMAFLLAGGALLVEDAGREKLDEKALFHCLNWAREQQGHVLITARSWPVEWGISLPDLASRLQAAPLVELPEPDADLLRQVLVKLFADRQLHASDALIDTVTSRMERSLASAAALVAELDRLSLARKRPLSRALALEILNSPFPKSGKT